MIRRCQECGREYADDLGPLCNHIREWERWDERKNDELRQAIHRCGDRLVRFFKEELTA